MELLAGILLGFLGIAAIVVIVVILLGHDPSTEPPERVPADARLRGQLFLPRAFKRATGPTAAGGGQETPPPFHRPLEVEPPPADEIIPPPREVRGVNREG